MSRRTPTVVTLCICIALAVAWWVPQAFAGTVLRGTDDTAIPTESAQSAQSRIDFLATKLHAGLLRVDVRWSAIEPRRGAFDDRVYSRLATAIEITVRVQFFIRQRVLRADVFRTAASCQHQPHVDLQRMVLLKMKCRPTGANS